MHLFNELGIVVGVACLVALLMRLLKQPLIIGHIITGLIVGPFVLGLLNSVETFALFSEIGIAILLFTVGLNLSPAIIRQFGKVSLLTGIGQVVFTTLAGFFIAILLGFSALASAYIAVALAFSSTIIILKLITDKGDIDVLYAKIAVGFLLVQDFVAILLLFIIPLLSTSDSSWSSFGLMLGKGIGLIALLLVGSHYLMPKLNRFIAGSQEFLFLFALAWGIGIAALFKEFGFSLESGALIAGVALANLPSRHEINARLTPLRDFFIIIFFILLGSQMSLTGITSMTTTAIVLSLLVLVGNPIILMIILGYLGYRRKTSLQTGFTVAQISEFSLILVALGVKYGHVGSDVLSLVTLVGLVTIFGSTYLIMNSDTIYKYLAPFLVIFERRDAKEKPIKKSGSTVVLFGCNRIGTDFLGTFKKLGKKFLVVDYDPDTVEKLTKEKYRIEYGDAGDWDFLEGLNLSETELVISTIPDPETNVLVHKAAKAANPDAIVIVVAHRIKDAINHYDDGVDYVILPHFLGAQHAAELVVKYKNNKRKYKSLQKEHFEYLQLKLSMGHEHPNQHAAQHTK